MTHDEPLITNGCGEVSEEGYSVVIGVVSLICHDVLIKLGLMTEDLREPSAMKEFNKVESDNARRHALVVSEFSMLVCQFFTYFDGFLPGFSFAYKV